MELQGVVLRLVTYLKRYMYRMNDVVYRRFISMERSISCKSGVLFLHALLLDLIKNIPGHEEGTDLLPISAPAGRVSALVPAS